MITGANPGEPVIRTAIFDLDGTLLDSTPDIAHAVNRVFARHGLDRTEPSLIAEMVGNGAQRLVGDLLIRQRIPAAPSDIDYLTAAYLEAYAEEPLREGRLYPHVAEDLARLQALGWRLGVCTNKPQALTLSILEATGLGSYFLAVRGADSVPARKPDPGHLLAVLEDLGGGTALYVGDTEVDEATAQAAGVAFRGVAWAAPGRLSVPEAARLSRIADLAASSVA
ncbi:HAD-IA family hydrolase [Limimaricola pyoseonensis]|nr:HAD-IA family hydrolase [Limimaricola pyoseonensis]